MNALRDRNLIFYVNARNRVPGRTRFRRWHILILVMGTSIGWTFYYLGFPFLGIVCLAGMLIGPVAMYTRDQRKLLNAALRTRFLACPNCLYDRRHDKSPVCPECQWNWPKDRIRREWAWFVKRGSRKHPGYSKLRER